MLGPIRFNQLVYASGVLLLFLFFMYSLGINFPPGNRYDSIYTFIDDCKSNEKKVEILSVENIKIKSDDWYLRARESESKLSNCKTGKFLFYYFGICLLIGFGFFQYFIINKLQNNKVEEMNLKNYELNEKLLLLENKQRGKR